MDWLANINWHEACGNGKFLWIEWHFWKVIGWAGNAVFFSRFFVPSQDRRIEVATRGVTVTRRVAKPRSRIRRFVRVS